MSSTLLVWAKPVPAVISNSAAREMFSPGDVVDVQAGGFDFGSDIARLGWWRVVQTDAPVKVARGLLSGDLPDPHQPARKRIRRLRLDALRDRMTWDEVMAAADEVPRAQSSAIGNPSNVIG